MKDEEYEEEYEDGQGNEEEYYDEHDNQNVQNQQHQQHLQHQQQRQGHQQYYHQQQQQQQQLRPQPNGDGQGMQHYQRFRRDAPNLSDVELQSRLSCNRSRCALIKCTTTQLDTDSSAWIALRMRLVTQTLNLVSLLIANERKVN